MSSATGTGRTVTDISIPRSWEAITPAWMTRALAGRHPKVDVGEVSVALVDHGTTDRAAVRVTYSKGAGPESVFVKMQGKLGRRAILAAMGFLVGEARLYASAELPICMPTAYAALIDQRTLRATLVLEDIVAGGGAPNYASQPLTPDEVANGLAGLARLHGTYWGLDGAQESRLAWLQPLRMDPIRMAILGLGGRNGLQRADSLVSRDHFGDHLRNWRRLVSWNRLSIRATHRGTPTLLHGDAHVANTYRRSDGTIGFYDWQGVRRGSWEFDVGYFIVSTLSIDDRRSYERDLLHHYLDNLDHSVDKTPGWDEAWLRYRRTPPWGLDGWLVTLGMGGSDDYHDDGNSIAQVERFAAAFNDLETAAALHD